jgi:uncharacterized phage protein gp47/JayE
MQTKIKTIEELKQEFMISFMNNCGTKVSKVSSISVINGFAYAISKLVQKINKYAAQIEALLFPQYAVSNQLDDIALREGVSSRMTGTKSSVVITFIGNKETIYPNGTKVKNTSGLEYVTTKEIKIGYDDDGNSTGKNYSFVIAECFESGTKGNTDGYSITQLVDTPPTGHSSLYNSFAAINGTDSEDDFNFRRRIINSEDILSKNTQAYYEALVQKFQPDALKIFSQGLGTIDDKFEIAITKNNLGNYTNQEINNIWEAIIPYVPLSEYSNLKLTIRNILYVPVNIRVPVFLKKDYTIDEVYKNIELKLIEFFDYTTLDLGKKINYEEILNLCRNVDGVEDIDDNNFFPLQDIYVPEDKLARIYQVEVYDVKTGKTPIIQTDLLNSLFVVPEENIYFKKMMEN